jgi:hypothetical protein
MKSSLMKLNPVSTFLGEGHLVIVICNIGLKFSFISCGHCCLTYNAVFRIIKPPKREFLSNLIKKIIKSRKRKQRDRLVFYNREAYSKINGIQYQPSSHSSPSHRNEDLGRGKILSKGDGNFFGQKERYG